MSLTVRGTYKPRLAGGGDEFGSERAPLRLDVYGTHQLRGCQAEPLLCNADGQFVNDECTFELHFEHPLRGLRRDELPYAELHRSMPCSGDTDEPIERVAPSAALVFCARATTTTKSKQTCWTEVGCAIVLVGALLKMAQCEDENERYAFPVLQNRDVEPTLHAVPIDKGQIVLHSVQWSKRVPTLAPMGPYDFDANDRLSMKAWRANCNLINSGMAQFFSANTGGASSPPLAQPTVPALMPFHVPEYRGKRMTTLSSAYIANYRLVRGEPDWRVYAKLLRLAALRSNLAWNSAMKLLSDTVFGYATDNERTAAVALCVRTLTAFATSLCYLDDFNNRHVAQHKHTELNATQIVGDEDFKVARLSNGDDCEGVALECYIAYDQFCRYSPPHPMLRYMASILHRYVPALALGCVTNAKMTSEKLDQSNALAHTYFVLLPKNWMLARMPANVRAEIGESADDTYDWPVMFCEGTAPIDPLLTPVARHYQGTTARYLASNNALKRMSFSDVLTGLVEKHNVPYVFVEVFAPNLEESGDDYSPFYKWVCHLSTHRWLASGYTDFALVYNRDLPGHTTYGVRANDVLDAAENVDLVPILHVGSEDARLVDTMLMDEQPLPQLTLDAHQCVTCNWMMRTQVKHALTEMRKKFGARFINQPTILHKNFLYFTTRERDLDENFLQFLASVAQLKINALNFNFTKLSNATDGTQFDHCILDVYLQF